MAVPQRVVPSRRGLQSPLSSTLRGIVTGGGGACAFVTFVAARENMQAEKLPDPMSRAKTDVRGGLRTQYPIYVANEPVQPNTSLEVRDKFTGRVATRTAVADRETIERAIAQAAEAFDAFRRWPAWQRKDVLQHVVKRLGERHEEFAQVLAVEAGKGEATATVRLPQPLPAGAGQERILGVRPEHLLPILDGSAAQLSLDVELVEALGAELLVHARCGGQALVLRCPANVPVSTGQRIGASFGAGDVHWFDVATTKRLG